MMPDMKYRSASLPMNIKIEQKMRVTEMKILRWL